MRLCDKGAGGGALVSPGWWQGTNGLVVAGETVDAGLDQNESELAVLVLAVALKMLANGDGLRRVVSSPADLKWTNVSPYLLDKHVEVLWDFWCEA